MSQSVTNFGSLIWSQVSSREYQLLGDERVLATLRSSFQPTSGTRVSSLPRPAGMWISWPQLHHLMRAKMLGCERGRAAKVHLLRAGGFYRLSSQHMRRDSIGCFYQRLGNLGNALRRETIRRTRYAHRRNHIAINIADGG